MIHLLDYTGRPVEPDDSLLSRIKLLTGTSPTDFACDIPEILLFLSGGSERYALERARSGGHYLLIGSRHGNSYASATEVKAWMNSMGIPSILLDQEAMDTPRRVQNFRKAGEALESLRGKRIGMIGKVSGWLVASDIPATRLQEKFGIERIDIGWDQLPRHTEVPPSADFLDYFRNPGEFELTETARVSELLSLTIAAHNLDAITVECFPLVKENHVTACLPLARFNDLSFPAGCEGDLTALTGMMLVRELTGTVPWIANINEVSETGCLFSHCTIAPQLVDDLTVKTHYETNEGTAIQGRFRSEEVTVFRIDQSINRAFIASGIVTDRPRSHSACRTQITVQLPPSPLALLREDPLGNHHLILPGDHGGLLRSACWLADIKVMG
jgi:L-fucose isomerase-like protein